MNQWATTCAAFVITGVMAGCQADGSGWNHPLKKKAPGTATAKTPDQADYFEIRKDGNIYVLGSNDSREALMGGQVPPLKKVTLEDGKTVMVENGDYNDHNRLVAEYRKARGL